MGSCVCIPHNKLFVLELASFEIQQILLPGGVLGINFLAIARDAFVLAWNFWYDFTSDATELAYYAGNINSA